MNTSIGQVWIYDRGKRIEELAPCDAIPIGESVYRAIPDIVSQRALHYLSQQGIAYRLEEMKGSRPRCQVYVDEKDLSQARSILKEDRLSALAA